MKAIKCPHCKALGIDTYATWSIYVPKTGMAKFQCLPDNKTDEHHIFWKKMNPSEKKDDATRSSPKLL